VQNQKQEACSKGGEFRDSRKGPTYGKHTKFHRVQVSKTFSRQKFLSGKKKKKKVRQKVNKKFFGFIAQKRGFAAKSSGMVTGTKRGVGGPSGVMGSTTCGASEHYEIGVGSGGSLVR